MNGLTEGLSVTDRLLEIHTFLVTLIRQFDFSLPYNGQEVRKLRPGSTVPMVVGEEDKGAQMPLKVIIRGN